MAAVNQFFKIFSWNYCQFRFFHRRRGFLVIAIFQQIYKAKKIIFLIQANNQFLSIIIGFISLYFAFLYIKQTRGRLPSE